MAVNPGYSTSPQLLITGAFDDLRSSHIRFLEEAARFGEVTALVWSDDLVRQRTGSAPRFPERERLYLLQGIRYVSYAAIFSGDAGELGASMRLRSGGLWPFVNRNFPQSKSFRN